MTANGVMTITEFLLARIAEDEADAQDALERGFGGWEWLADAGINHEARTHIVRWHPARVLAECEAKRQIVELHASTGDKWEAACVVCAVEVADYASDGQGGESYDPRLSHAAWPCATLRHLAAVYSDHSDYRDEWRP